MNKFIITISVFFLPIMLNGQFIEKKNISKIDPYIVLYYSARYNKKFDVKLNDSLYISYFPLFIGRSK